jgi:hypothetical protein
MPKDDGLVADVQSRASGALYNWNRPFNDQSVAYYKARHREDIELNRARRAAVGQAEISVPRSQLNTVDAVGERGPAHYRRSSGDDRAFNSWRDPIPTA